MTPGEALAVTTVFTVLGPIVAGTAVADTVGGLVEIDTADVLQVLAAALLAAVGWNLLTWWLGLPSSSSHALVGGLVGSSMATAGAGAVNWGGFDGWRPVGVLGVLVVLAASPLIGGFAGWAMDASARRRLRRADRAVTGPLKAGQWVTSRHWRSRTAPTTPRRPWA
jgi:PiT family inorganic phosphate transporter